MICITQELLELEEETLMSILVTLTQTITMILTAVTAFSRYSGLPYDPTLVIASMYQREQS